MRAIAEEAFDLVRATRARIPASTATASSARNSTKRCSARRIVAFEDVKTRFDPTGLLNPGKIVQAPKMDDRSLFRYSRTTPCRAFETDLDWSDWPAGGGFQGAVEMCNNNGACRKLEGRRDVPLLPRDPRGTAT